MKLLAPSSGNSRPSSFFCERISFRGVLPWSFHTCMPHAIDMLYYQCFSPFAPTINSRVERATSDARVRKSDKMSARIFVPRTARLIDPPGLRIQHRRVTRSGGALWVKRIFLETRARLFRYELSFPPAYNRNGGWLVGLETETPQTPPSVGVASRYICAATSLMILCDRLRLSVILALSFWRFWALFGKIAQRPAKCDRMVFHFHLISRGLTFFFEIFRGKNAIQ